MRNKKQPVLAHYSIPRHLADRPGGEGTVKAMIGENTPLRPQVRRGWLRTPGQPSGALVWWDGQKYRTVNPSAPYPLRTKRSMNSVSTTAAHVVLAMAVVVAIAGVLFWLLLPVAGLLFFLALALYAMPTTVRSRWSGVSNKDRGAIDAYLTYLYENYCPDGWKVDNSRSTIADQQDALRILGVHKNVVAHGFRPIFPVWRNNTITVGAQVSEWSLSGRHTRIGEDVSYYPRHLAICELKGTYALPAVHIWRETDLTKMVNVTTRADRDTAFVEFNRNFAVSVDTTDHPLLEPHLLELINAEVNRDYVYHFEGDLLVIISQRADTDVAAFAAHASDVFGAVPPYLYR